MRMIKVVSDALTAKTKHLLASGRGVGKGGRCDYNLTLINLMEEEDSRGGALRDKAGNNLGGGQIAVSWHADSSLEDFSSIAVLNLTLPQAGGGGGGGGGGGKGGRGKRGGAAPWSGSADGSRSFRIAMKCVGEGHEPPRGSGKKGGGGGGGGTPVLAMPLKGGDAYYMLNDFNHHHHHAVLAGSGQGRYSSTHRVAVTATDTWQHVQQRCEAALGKGEDEQYLPPVFGAEGDVGVLLADRLRLVEEVHTEIEFEWLRQWGAQGQAHAATHQRYWAPRMQELEATWRRLEAWTAAHCRFLADAAAATDGHRARAALPEGVRCYDVLEQLLIKRRGMRPKTASFPLVFLCICVLSLSWQMILLICVLKLAVSACRCRQQGQARGALRLGGARPQPCLSGAHSRIPTVRVPRPLSTGHTRVSV